MSAPDTLAFAASVLESRGALVEHELGRVLALVPAELARTLELPESAELVAGAPSADQIACGLGSALLDRLIADARSASPVASVQLDVAPPRASAARALAERFVIRNAVYDMREVRSSRAVYAAAWLSWSAQADDRHDGLVRLVACADDGSEPASGWSELPDPTDAQRTLALLPMPGLTARGAVPFVAARTERAVRDAVHPIAASTQRRHARDHARIGAYYDALIEEARNPRRRVDRAALDAKIAHLAAERDAKLGELEARFALGVSLEPVAILLVDVPVAEVVLHVRRRKREGDLVVRLPAGAGALDLVSCDGCRGATSKPLVCDDALHRLCERCVPSAEGRPRCPACSS